MKIFYPIINLLHWYCYSLGLKCPSRVSCVQRWGFWKVIGSWWLLGDSSTDGFIAECFAVRWVLLEEVDYWRCFWKVYHFLWLFLPLSAPWLPWCEWPSSTRLFDHDISVLEPVDHDFSCFKLWMSCVLSSNKKADWYRYKLPLHFTDFLNWGTTLILPIYYLIDMCKS